MTKTNAFSWTVRSARLPDQPIIVKLNILVQQLHHQAEPDVYKFPSHEAIAREVAGQMETSEMQLLVADSGNVPTVGYLLLEEKHSEESAYSFPLRYVEVHAVAVQENWRRQGVGQALLAAAQQWAGQRGIEQLFLNVRGFNAAALTAYEAMGFERLQTRLSRFKAP